MRTATHQRRIVCLLVAVLFACVIPAACSSGGGFEMTVRVRDGIGPSPVRCQSWFLGRALLRGEPDLCKYEGAEQVWTDGGGRRVIQPAQTLFLSILAGDFGAFECGGRTITNVYRNELDVITIAESDPFQLLMEDGSVIELSFGEGFNAGGRALDSCTDVSGLWHGIAGDLDDRTGTYTLVNDSIQTVLHLVED
jgi:hypothetical protein